MFEMTFYCAKQPDGTIHVQNAVKGYLGQHHVHTPEDFEKCRNGDRVVSLAVFLALGVQPNGGDVIAFHLSFS